MKWNIDSSHTTAGFSVRHLMITNVKGRFGKVEGYLEYDAARPLEARAEVTIDASSIDTRDEKRDAHLRSPDFFEVEKYPTLTFKSTKVTKTDDGFALTGDLTMRGVTKPVTLNVEGPTSPNKDPWGNERIGASATGKLNRTEWGLNFNAALETGGVLVGEQVKLEIDISFVRAQLAPNLAAQGTTAKTDRAPAQR